MATKVVEIIKAHPLISHEVGEKPTLQAHDADMLIESGYAVEVIKDAAKKKADADKGKQQAIQ